MEDETDNNANQENTSQDNGNDENVVTKPIHKVVQKSKGFFASLISVPTDFIKGIFSGAFKSVAGLGKGIFGNTIGNPLGVATTGGILFGLTQFTPSLAKWLSDKIGKVGKDGKTLAETYVDDKKEGGTGKAIMDLGLAAVILNGGMGALGGAFSGVVDASSGKDRSFSEKAGSFLSSGAVIAGLGFLAFTKISSTSIGSAEHVDNGTKIPPPTPPKTADATPHIP